MKPYGLTEKGLTKVLVITQQLCFVYPCVLERCVQMQTKHINLFPLKHKQTLPCLAESAKCILLPLAFFFATIDKCFVLNPLLLGNSSQNTPMSFFHSIENLNFI